MLPLSASLWLSLAPLDLEPSHQQASADLDAALATVDDADIDATIVALERAIERVTQVPPGSVDPELSTKLATARLSLVWLLLDRDEAAAAVAMDEAIRAAQGSELPVRSFGPDVLVLHDSRQEALARLGTATIEVECGMPCTLVVDERKSTNPSVPLYLGTYRVWIGASDGSTEWEYAEVTLDDPGETVKLDYQIARTVDQPLTRALNEPLTPTRIDKPRPPTQIDEPRPPSRPIKRFLPRWAEILGLGAGAGLAITGAILLSYDGKCRNGANPLAPETCPEVYSNSPQAYSLIGIGAGVFVLSGVMLTIDEIRLGRSRAQRAMLTWTLRF